MNNLSACKAPQHTGSEDFAYKGSRFSITAFLLLVMVLPFAGCESPGLVGSGLGPDEENIKTLTVETVETAVIDGYTYSGGLPNTALGIAEDPEFGSLRAVAFLKPGISESEVDTIEADDTMTLKLVFNSAFYGDSMAVSNYEIYEAGELWRGNEVRYGDELSVNLASKVGEFQVGREDSLEVELSGEWTQKFAGFFNSTSADRDSLYRTTFPGLAIVPAESNQNMRFLRHSPASEDDESVTAFVVHSPESDDDDDDENEPQTLTLRDYATSFTRSNAPDPDSEDHYLLHNTGTVLKVDLDLPADELESKNIINAQFLLFPDSPEAAFHRPEPEFIQAHVLNENTSDVISEMFVTDASFGAALDDTTDTHVFKLNITDYVLNKLYANPDQKNSLYISLQAVNGIIYSGRFFNKNAAATRKPRLIITYVEDV